ncbi:TPA: restriction endonuclease subunit S [Vibrio parahaemolyticus]
MSKLPQGWVECKLGDVMTLVNGRAYKKHEMLEDSTDAVPILRIQNLNGGDNWFYSNLSLADDKYCYKGDLLYAWSATFGPYWAKWDKAIFHYHIWNIKPTSFATLRFSYYVLSNITAAIKSAAHGVAMPHMTKSGMESWSINVPSLPEQKRIVEKLDEVLAQVDTIKARLDGIPDLLKRFRQSVLASAVSGKLTEEWRSVNAVTPVNDLIHSCVVTDKRNNKNADKPFRQDEITKEIPTSWTWVRLARITEVVSGVAKGSKTKSEVVTRPYLRVANVQRGYLDLSEIKEITVPVDKAESLVLKPGDILFNEGGDIDKLGRGWIWEGQVINCIHQNHVFRARVYSSDLEPKYISHYGNSRGKEYFLREGTQSVNLANINKTTLSLLPVPLPPKEEQKEIVRLVDQYFAFADTIEAQVKKAQTRVDNLTQSILAKAFRGELVPQNDDDESAEVLLERIAQARKEAEALAKAAKKAGKKKA